MTTHMASLELFYILDTIKDNYYKIYQKLKYFIKTIQMTLDYIFI